MKTVGNFIGGQVCLSSSNQTVDVLSLIHI